MATEVLDGRIPLGDSGLEVSRVGFGTYHLPQKLDGIGCLRALGRASARGVTLFDTSDNYGSEVLIGAAIARRYLPRDEVVIATKTGLATSLEHRRELDAAERRYDTSPERVRRQVDASLTMLGVNEIDLYQLHAYDPKVSASEQAGVMDELVGKGKIRAWGVSNYPADALINLVTACDDNGLTRPVSSQPFFNLLADDADGQVSLSRGFDLTTLAHSPLVKGMLTDTALYELDKSISAEDGSEDLDEDNKAALDLYSQFTTELENLRQYGKERNLSLAQLAIAWAASHPNTVVLSACTNDAYLDDAIIGVNHQIDPNSEELAPIRDRLVAMNATQLAIHLMRGNKHYYL